MQACSAKNTQVRRTRVKALAIGAVCLASMVGQAQAYPTLTTEYSFPYIGTIGTTPYYKLVPEQRIGQFARATTLWGVTQAGPVQRGVGMHSVMYKFQGFTNTASVVGNVPVGLPQGPLVQIPLPNGQEVFIGTTVTGGLHGLGMVYKYDSQNPTQITDIHDFAGGCGDGSKPSGSLATTGPGQSIVIGTTTEGGCANDGTIFVIDASGNYWSSFEFSGSASQGKNPQGVVRAGNGNLVYGAVPTGGINGTGYVYSFDPFVPQLIPVCNFFSSSGAYGYQPDSDLTVATNPVNLSTNIYGTTMWNSINGHLGTGSLFECNPQTQSVSFLHYYGTQAGADRSWDPGAPVMASGRLFGTDYAPNGAASVFAYDFTTSTFHDDFYFTGGMAGSSAAGGLIYFRGGLYGVTPDGGTDRSGSIFRLDGY